MSKTSTFLERGRVTWLEAEVLRDPLRPCDLKEPTVLVRRRVGNLLGPNGEELFYLPGYPAISLFTGAGGMDLGLEQAGFCCVCQHEQDEAACATLIVNRPRAFRHAALIQGDIRHTPTSMILAEAGLLCGEAHVVAGGPPCQGFSTSGKRQAGDVRNTLVFEFLRVIREAQPKFFIMENVPGFMSLAGGRFLTDFLRLAYDGYYELVYGIVNAVEYGVPQNRNRFICMGTRRDLAEIEGVLASMPGPECFGARDLEALRWSDSHPLFAHETAMIRHPPGVRYFPDRPVLRPPAPCIGTDSEERTKAFLSFYSKLLKEEPDRIVSPPRRIAS